VHNAAPTAALGDRVWYDTNSNGVQDDGEDGTPNIPVTLLDSTCTVEMGHTTTDNDGLYHFTNLEPGSYCVKFDISSVASVYNFSPKDVGNDAKDSDADSNGKTTSVTLAAGDNNLTLDAGLVKKSLTITAEPLCIKDAPYLKYTVSAVNFTPGSNPVTIRFLNNNGGADQGKEEAKLTGQPLSATLLWPGAAVDSKGVGAQWPGWEFTNGQWVQIPTGLRPNITVEFSVNPTETADVVYPPSNPTCSTDPRAALGDRVWIDSDHDGIQDTGEVDVAGVKVTLFDSNNQQVGQPLTTDGNGNYLFTGLYPATYYVVFDKTTLPPGFEFTTANANSNGSDTTDSDADETTGKTASVTLVAGQTYLDLDAGIFKESNPELAALGDTVWFDINKNGLQDNGEVGVPGVQVVLHKADASVVATQTTNAAGKYLFTELQPGTYYVEFATVKGYSYTRHDVSGNSKDAADSDPHVPWIDFTIGNDGKDIELGKPFAFTIFYTNTESIEAKNLVISKTVPAGTSLKAGDDLDWTCDGTTPGSLCTLTLGTLAANASGSKTFTLNLSNNADEVPDFLDLIVSFTNGTLGRTDNVTLVAGETNLTVDAGLVQLVSSMTLATPTEPTNLPDDHQPEQSPRKLFLPSLQDNPTVDTSSLPASQGEEPAGDEPAQLQGSLYLPAVKGD
jgi:hypothetical protein